MVLSSLREKAEQVGELKLRCFFGSYLMLEPSDLVMGCKMKNPFLRKLLLAMMFVTAIRRSKPGQEGFWKTRLLRALALNLPKALTLSALPHDVVTPNHKIIFIATL